MKAETRILARKQLDKRLSTLENPDALARPPRGWLKAIRESLGMTTTQLAKRLHVSQPRIINIEKSEVNGSITLDTLERAAHALNCRLVYTLVPKISLEEMFAEQVKKLALKQLKRTSHSMQLEAQGVLKEEEEEMLKVMLKKYLEKAGSEIWEESDE